MGGGFRNEGRVGINIESQFWEFRASEMEVEECTVGAEEGRQASSHCYGARGGWGRQDVGWVMQCGSRHVMVVV